VRTASCLSRGRSVAYATGKGGFDLTSENALLYDKVIFVLFNLPDFIVISTYFLLMNVWIETYRGSRRHWFGSEKFRRKWTIFYLVFNTCLYSVGAAVPLCHEWSGKESRTHRLVRSVWLEQITWAPEASRATQSTIDLAIKDSPPGRIESVQCCKSQ
jgi:hypothetical protein